MKIFSIVLGGIFLFSTQHASADTKAMKAGPASATVQYAKGVEVKLTEAGKDGVMRLELLNGMVRVKVVGTPDKKPVFEVHTKAAVMGVRGTDFVAIANPVLGESEIVVLDGTVEFTSVADATDTKLIPKGHWGGIGGRFGAKSHDLIALSADQLKFFDKASNVK